jgi:ubiquitin-protein ligase E3 A
VPREVLSLCQPEELELLVCGSKELDFRELQKESEYVDGYTEDSQIVKWLWEIVLEEMSEFEKKKFLQFSTGCDRAPVGGLGTLPFYVGRHGPDTERLPTAHTCFNHLLIPEYTSKDKLKTKLINAIQNAEGFGLY